MARVVVDLPLLNLWRPDKWDQKILLSSNEYIRKAEPDEIKLQKGACTKIINEKLVENIEISLVDFLRPEFFFKRIMISQYQ